jgi:hypothetical protein
VVSGPRNGWRVWTRNGGKVLAGGGSPIWKYDLVLWATTTVRGKYRELVSTGS